ncbi:MAG TPA: T9SS type A sorting domain-containing protein, partial [Bacteroidia bacterium]|nr:T9SS type A sorting domain-containing protein [Bacteroidia bacterium]
TVVVKVNPLPTITITPSSAVICAGSDVALKAGGAVTYVWSPAGGLSTTAFDTTTAAPATTKTYTVTGTSASGCVNAKTVKITVNPLPVLTITPSSSTICIGGSVKIVVAGASTYVWSPGTSLSATTGASVTATPTVSVTYTITGTSTTGCVSVDSVKVTVLPVVTASVTATHDSVCPGDSTTLTASGGTIFSWSTGATTSSITVAPKSKTTYKVTVGNGGCTATASITISMNTVTVPKITVSGDTLKCTPTGLPTYQWYRNDTSIAGGTFDTLIISKTGSYKVYIINAMGCSDTAVLVVNTLVGIDEISLNQFVEIYPNPTRSSINVALSIPDGEYTLNLTDVLGQVLFTKPIHVSGKYYTNIDMTNFSEGVYIFSLKGMNSTAEKKILVTH